MVILAYYFDKGRQVDLTDKDYSGYLKLKDLKIRKAQIADLIFYRLHGRYLKPFQFPSTNYRKEFKNGFSILANCCLLIEAIQSFKNGWDETPDRKGKEIFENFLSKNKTLSVLANKNFYKNVRCGILHQGETTGGWKITRENKKIFDVKSLTIDANIFAEEIEKVLRKYIKTLKAEEWDSEVWDNCRVKMRKIINNSNSK